VLTDLASWHWNDAVSELYREVISEATIVALNHNSADTIAEWQRRVDHRVPPGYKDKGKDDSGIGDFLIWLSILAVGKNRGSDVIFVSGDEKSDWWYQSENAALILVSS
jgi:hypothetical protein